MFAATVSATVPLDVPVWPDITVIHGTVLAAVQEQPLSARIRARGGDDLVDLHLRQLPASERGLGLGKLLEVRRGV